MKMRTKIATVGLGFAVGLVLSSCEFREPNPEHCLHASGDATCRELYGLDRQYCTSKSCDESSEDYYGCVSERPTDECYFVCGEGRSILEDDDCPEAGDGDGDGDTGDGDGDGDTGDGDGDGDTEESCMVDEDCVDALVPFCDVDSGECVSCDQTAEPDMSCTNLDPAAPVCEGTTCVQCTADNDASCVETTPICDVATNMCVGCSEHAQCPESACNFELGNCMDPATVVHVDGDGGQDYMNVGGAVADNAGAPELTVILHEKTAPAYIEATFTNNNDYVAVLAAPGEAPVMTGTNMNPAMTVEAGVTVYMTGISASGTQGGEGLVISGGSARVEKCRIVNNTGGGIMVDGGGTLVLENSFVGGGNVTGVRAVDVINGTVDIAYSTLGAGFGSGAAGLICADGTGSSIRNSIVLTYGGDPELVCDNAEMSGNITEMDVPAFDDQSGWFLDFSSGDFHLAPGMYPSAIDTAAQWQAGDTTTDIDGDPRPTRDGAPDFAGADLIP